MNRFPPGGPPALKQFGPFVLDMTNECLWREGAQIGLQPKPFAVLRYLVENPGRLITHDELLDKLWPDTFVQPQVLRTYMLELRRILGDDAGRPRFIQTLPKRGYCFMAPVTEKTAKPPIAAASAEPAAGFDRHAELEMLGAELEAMTQGQRRVILIGGETGIGKTALVDAFLRGVATAALVARGQCVPAGEDFYPVVEALGQLCASAEGEVACRALSRLAPGWLHRAGQPAEQPAGARDCTSGSLCAALEEIAATRPLILVLEDLQWVDRATLDLLAALTRRRAPAALMVLATWRPRRVAANHPLKELRHELRLQRLCTEIALAPLPKAAIVTLLGAELGQPELPAGLGAFIQQRAEGNPLFATIILRHLIAQRLLRRKGAAGQPRWELAAGFADDAGVPDELAQMVEIEIERLSPEEQRLLEAGSLLPVAFPAWAVAAALETDPADTEEACEALARKVHFLERAGQDELPDGTRSAFFVFSHAVYREVLYHRQAASRRARRHVRVAEHLSALFAGREAYVAREIAMHYEAADNWRMGAQALRAAAQYASARGAHAEAGELLERALRVAAHRSDAGAEAAMLREELDALRGRPDHAPAEEPLAAGKV
ncbi:MAG: AAA family ATPase [Acidobacteriota bacterium]